MDFKEQWDLDTAMKVVQNKTVDSKLWAEAVEWLLLYGPPEIVSILLQASGHATDQCFPELQPSDYTSDGTPVYDISELAKSLDMSENEVQKILKEKEKSHKMVHIFNDGSSQTVH
ncbi:MAG: hypothetical protein WBW79_18820 [Desulfocapsaceae bacterium]